jgi:flagellar protein FliO/FliZ
MLRFHSLCAFALVANLAFGYAANAQDVDAGAFPLAVAGPTISPVIPEPVIPQSIPPELAADDLNLGWTLVRTIVVLGMVVFLAWLTLNVGLRKLLGIRPVVGTKLVTVLERVALDQKRSLFVVQVADEYLLLGGSDNSLNLISKLDSNVANRIPKPSNLPIQLSPFLKKMLGKKGDQSPAENSSVAPSSENHS